MDTERVQKKPKKKKKWNELPAKISSLTLSKSLKYNCIEEWFDVIESQQRPCDNDFIDSHKIFSSFQMNNSKLLSICG